MTLLLLILLLDHMGFGEASLDIPRGFGVVTGRIMNHNFWSFDNQLLPRQILSSLLIYLLQIHSICESKLQ